MNPANLLDALREIVGHDHVLTADTHDLTAWELDWRKRERGQARAVVRPSCTEQVAAVVKLCATHKVALVPQGGNTGMVVGATPDASGQQVVLSLQRMNKVRRMDPANLTITVDAGCILQQLQDSCAQEGFLFPLSLASEGSCTIGGNLATNAGGTQVVRYGNTRELCLGLEVVTAQGEIWNGLSGLRKDNTGYDLRHLFIGSEGTLGIITGAVMKIYPQPAAQLTAFAAVPSLQAAVDLLGLSHQTLASGLSGFEVMGQFALSLVAKHFPQQRIPFWQDAPYCVVLEHSDAESETHARTLLETLLEKAIESGCVQDAVVAENLAQAQALWHIRESIPLAQAQEGLNIKHDISITVSRIPDFVEECNSKLLAAFPGAQLVTYGHLGDGNLHYNVQAAPGEDQEKFLVAQEPPMNALVYACVDAYAGSISAEHGIGSLKVDTLPDHKSATAMGLMRAIKMALDPDGLLNPGKMIRA